MWNKLFTTQKITQVLFTSSLILILIGFIATGIFLYSHFYKIILQTEEIIIIQAETFLEPIKINLLNDILENLAVKTQGGVVEVTELKNPFK